MKKVTFIIIASVISLFFMLKEGFAGDILNLAIHEKTDIIGATVRNLQGEKLGEISNLTFDRGTGDITYVILSHEDITGNGEKLTPVPLHELRFISEKNAQLNISRGRLASLPGFEKRELTDITDRQLNKWLHSIGITSEAGPERGVMKTGCDGLIC